jgi:hypothetical protein
MPFALLLVGILLITVAVRNQQTAFVQLVRSDFSGPSNFMYWVVALVLIGSIGYIPKAKPVSNLLIALILIVLILKRGNPATGAGGGVFQKLTAALGGTNTAQQNATVSSLVGTATGAANAFTGGTAT